MKRKIWIALVMVILLAVLYCPAAWADDGVPEEGTAPVENAQSDAAQAPEAAPDTAGQAPETAPETAAAAPEAAPEEGVQAPEAAPGETVQAPEAAPEEGVQAPEAAPEEVVQTPEAAPDETVQALEAAPEEGVQTPEAAPEEGVQTPEAAPEEGVQAPEAVPGETVQAPEAAPEEAGLESMLLSAASADENGEAAQAAEEVPEEGEAPAMMLLSAAPAAEDGAEDAVVAAEDQNEAEAALRAAPASNGYHNLQDVINGEVNKQTDHDGIVVVHLDTNTQYDGDVVIEKEEGKTYGEGFGIELVANDAGEDGLQADGATVVNGKITIRSVPTRIKGIKMDPSTEIVVKDAELEYYGTKTDDTVKIEVDGENASAHVETGEGNDTITAVLKDKAEAEIDTGDGNDTVQAELQAENEATIDTGDGNDIVTIVERDGSEAAVDTGDGNDTVNAQLTEESELTVSTGEGMDVVNAQVQDHSEIVVDTDAGNDTVNAQITTEGEATISSGDGDDTVNVQVEMTTAKSEIDTGDGNDTVTVDARAGLYELAVVTGEGDDTVNVQHSGTGAQDPAGIIEVDMGDGMDQANVDLGVADAAERVVVRGGESSDRLHVTGELNKDTDEDERATGGESNMVLQGANNALNIEVYDVETVTDSLENKKTVTVEQGTTEIEVNSPFTNYVYKAPAGTIAQLTVKAASNANLALCSLIIDTATTLSGDNKLTLDKNVRIDARGINLILRAKEIEIDGILKAKAIVLDAAAGTGIHDRNFAELRNEINQSLSWFPLPDVVDAGAATVAGADMALDLLNVNDEASVVIGEHAELYSAGDVLMNAKVAQDGGIITLLPFLNPVNVKVAGAHVDVAGKVYAGYDFAAEQVVTGQGSVRMNADVKITTGFQSDGKTYSGLPIGVTVAIADAGVHVAKDAVIEAGRDVTAASQTNIKIYNRADSGVGGLPVAVAATILVSDVDTTVEGTLQARTGSVAITAGGVTDVVTLADKGTGQTMISGGYVGASVALQNVRAQIAEGAAVTAGGSVKVKSVANELVKTGAAAANPDTKNDVEGGLGGAILGAVAEYLPQIKDKILPKYSAKWDEAIKKLATSSTSVQVDSEAKEHGDVSVETAVTDGEKWATVTVTPADGYKVKRIVWRGMDPGAQSCEWGASITNVLIFPLRVKNVTVFVEYEEAAKLRAGEDGKKDLFAEKKEPDAADPLQMVSDVVASTAEDQTKDDKKDAAGETEEKLSLTFKGTGGAVLTYDFDSEAPGKNLDKAAPGQKLRLMPNPAQGKKLKQGGLKMVYEVTEEGKSVKKTIVVDKDDQGRYVAEIPADADKKAGITFTAEFVDADNKDAEADDTQVQVTGTIAVTVARNDNKALVADSAVVTAGGSLEISAVTKTQITTEANGSSATKAGAAAPKKDSDAIKRPQSIAYAGFDAAGRYYGLMIDGTENGDVTYVQNGPDGAYSYTFTATPKDDRFQVTGAAFIYYSEGKRTALKLEPNAEGKYDLDILNITGAMDKGSIGIVCFTFGGPAYREEHVYHQDAQVIIPNPIKITYNAIKKEKENAIEAYSGKIYFKNTEIEDGKIKAYVFDAVPELEKGYVLDGKLKASWVMLDGSTREVELTRREGDINRYWYLDPKDVPVGALITVTGTFKNDLHTFKVDTENTKNGTITLHDSQVKTSDAPKINITPSAGYSLDEVTVTMPGSGNTVTLKKKDLTAIGEGKYQFTVTPLREDAEVKVSATFKLKSIGLYASDGQSSAHDTDQFQLSAYNAAKGDSITVTPNAEKVKQGYKVSEITVKDESGKTVVQSASGAFTVPNDTADGAKLTVTVGMKLKEVALEKADLEHGTVTPDAAYADRGDKVSVTVKPADNYRLKKGTLKAVINATDGSYTEEVYMARANDNTYTFLMPEGIEDPTKVKLTFTGEFIPGQSDTSAVETSLGAGAAVSVVNSESRAEIGKATAAASGNIAVTATETGGVKTGAKAGYSKGNVGIGGAVAVQVASMDSKALIQEGASLTLNGNLKLQAEGETDFGVNADAAGNPAAKKAGVGAGIAVAVNGSDVTAAVADGVKLAPKTKDGTLKGISIVAARKGTDAVTAKAGVAGGASVVPVAAVDVTGTSATASLGKVADGMLSVTSTALSASNSMFHTVSADAASAGQGVGLGAAFGVSVLSDASDAVLQQSVTGEKTTVASETVSSLTSTVTASASGGDAKKKSADQQTDGLLDTASLLAGKNGSASVSPNLINGAKNDRQQAETTEGTVGGAGAVAVNVQHSRNTSFIADGVDVQADDLVAVKAQNGTVAKIKANGSTTNSDYGVGIGVAVNVVNLTNEARIGDGRIDAGTLEVTAATKAATPAKKKAAPKVQTKDQLARQLADALRSYLRDLMKEMGLDGYVSDDILGPIVENVTAATVEKLVKVTGLDTLLGGGDLKDKYDAAVKLLTKKGEGLMNLPAELIAPFLEALQDLEGFSELTVDDLARIAEAVESEFTTQLANKLPTVGNTFLDHVKDGMLKYLKDHASELVSGLWNGGNIKSGAGDVVGKLLKAAGQEVLQDAKTALQTLANDLFKETLDRVSIPGLTPQKADRVLKALKSIKDAYQKDDYSLIFENAAKRVSSIFCAEVFDYEAMLSKFAKDDFKKQLIEDIKGVLKTISVTLTNEAISTLTSHADLVLASQVDRFNGHTVNTQAISGAGAREVGVSGSVAITVLNASTVAELTDEGKTVSVSGEMKVDAQEKRLVRNVASAALDAKGNASANKSAKTAANADVGDAAATVKGGKVTLTLGVGATGEIRQGDQADERPKIRLTLKDGYKMPENNEVHYSFTDEGFEASGTIAAQKDDDGWFVDPNSGDLANVPKGTDISLVLAPEAILYSIPSPAILTAKGVEEGAVTITAKDGTVENDTLRTHIGDKVEVKVANEKGRKIAGIGYSYKDDKGEVHDIALAKSSVTKMETVFLFDMPGFDVVDFVVQFDDDTGEETKSETSAQDATGKSIGVGAAFSMIYGNSDVHALIGTRGIGATGLKAGALTISAASAHQEDVASTAGTDPLTGQWNADAAKKIGADAAVSLNILDNSITAGITGAMTVSVGTANTEGDLVVEATEDSVSESNASSFAVGSSTAVGATAAVQISDSQVLAILEPSTVVRGQVLVSAESHSEDTTSAIATALGADIARMLGKVGQAADKLEEKSNKLLDGSYMDDIVKKGEESQEKDKQTKAAEATNKRLDEVKAKDGDKTSHELSTSSNVLRSMGVKKEGPETGGEGAAAAAAQIKDKTGQDVSTEREEGGSRFQVAAAVGVTVSSHSAKVELGGDITAKKVIAVLADNTGNFTTMGTAAAMSKAEHANAIAAGVAVGVNSNKATVDVQGSLVSADTLQGVVAGSRLTQNLDGDFAGKLAVQSLAGSVAGKDSEISLGGAISVLVSQGESSVRIAGGTKEAPRRLEGGRVTVEATDQSRLTGRAGGLSLSKGSSVGMGVGSTTIVSADTVEASVGEYTMINTRDLWLNAEKLPVTDEDYHSNLSLRTLITDSSQLTEEERANAKTGLIDVHKAEGESSYTVKVNLSEQKLLEAVDGLNFLSGRNIYAEAIAGSLMTGANENSKASAAGSFAVAVTQNTVRAILGANVTVVNTFGPMVGGNVNVNATNGNNIRIIAGSLSASAAKANVGATVAVLTMLDDVLADVGEHADITATNSFRQKATTDGEIQTITAAIAAASAQNNTNAIGGAVNVIVANGKTVSRLGEGTSLKAGKDVELLSCTDLDLLAISGNAALSRSSGSSVSAGGTVNVIVDKSVSRIETGKNVRINAQNSISMEAKVPDQLISGVASLSAALSSSDGKAFAGAVNVIVSESDAQVALDTGLDLNAVKGDLLMKADSDARLLNVTVAAAGANGVTIGGSFNINVLNRTAQVSLKDGRLVAGGDLKLQANGRDTNILAGLALAAAVKNGPSISGNVMVLVQQSRIALEIAKALNVTARRNAVLESYYSDYTVAAAGNISVSTGGAGVDATALTAVKNNEVITDLGSSKIDVPSMPKDAASTNLSGETVRGLYVGANALETQFLGGAGIAAAKGPAVNGVVAVLTKSDTVRADASKAAIAQMGDDNGSATVQAKSDTKQTLLAGGVNVSGSVSVGASVVTIVSGADVQALVKDVNAQGNANIEAKNGDDTTLLAINVGVSNSPAIQLGAAVQVMKSKVKANVLGTVTAKRIRVAADNDAALVNVAAALGISGNVAVTPVGVVTYFQGETEAKALSGSKMRAREGIDILSSTDKDVDVYTLGAAGAGTVGVSGAVNVLVSKDSVQAVLENGAEADAGPMREDAKNLLQVKAKEKYDLVSASAAIGGGSGAGVAVNAAVSVMKSRVDAAIAGKVTNGNVAVDAFSQRNVNSVVANVAGGQAGVGVTVLVLVTGDKMSQDAADMLCYGNAEDKSQKNTFDPDVFLSSAATAGADTSDIQDLGSHLEGNGHRESENTVGSNGSFDGASGYQDDAFYQNDGNAENLEASDTKDIQAAKDLNAYTYTSDPADHVIAEITKTAEINAYNVQVNADQVTTADLIAASVDGGMVGVGVSTSVAVLRSNVLAVNNGAVTLAGDMKITATSRGEALEADEARDSALKKTVGDKLDPTQKTIRSFAFTGAFGEVGVGVSVSVVLTDNMTRASLGGNVMKAYKNAPSNVMVNATQDYGNVLSATGAASGGLVAVNASVAVAQTNGTLTAEIAPDASVTVGDSVEVSTNANVGANAMAATAGFGGVAVNGGVGLAFNRMTQITCIGGGARVFADKDVIVSATGNTDAESMLLGVTAGGVGVTLNAAVSSVDQKVKTYIGDEDDMWAKVQAGGEVRVVNDLTSQSKPRALSLAAGGVAVGGNVLLSFTEGEAEALVTNTEVKAPKLTVSSTWDSTATSDFVGVQVGAIPVGISVNYADNHEENRATVNAYSRGGADFSGDVEVIAAGDSTVAVETMAGNAGAINVGLNTAIARNRRQNLATLTSDDKLTVGKGLTVKSEGKADASAKGLGVQMGAVNIGASVVVALNDAVNATKAELASSLNVGGKTKLTADIQDTTLAQLKTGSGSLIDVNVNVAAAYGRAKATVDTNVNNNSAFHGFTASATGKGETTSKIENYSYDVIAAAVMVGNAYSQEEYAARVQLNWDKYRNDASYGNDNGDWVVETKYDVTTVADVAPSAGGVDANLGKVMYNQAKAKNSAKADTVLSLTGGDITSGKDLKVNTEGRSSAKADLRTAELTLSALNIGVGRAISENAMEANARMEMKDCNVKIDGAFRVTSLVDEASANSRIGGSGSKNPTRVSLVSGDDNEARSYENMTVSAALLGTHEYEEQNLVDASGFTIRSGMKDGKQSGAWAASNGAKDYSLATIGNLEAEAVVTETIRAKMDGVKALIEGGEAKILALGNAVSSGVGSAPGSLRAIDGGRSNVTAKMGADGARQSVRVEIGNKTNDTGIWSRKDMEIRAENQGSATAEMERKGAYSLLNVNSSSQPTESWLDTGVTIFKEAGLSTNGKMTVSSLSGVTAQSKVDNKSLGLVLNVDTMKGENKADDINRLIVEDGAALNAEGDLTLLANTDFNIDAETIYQGGYDFIGSTSIQAQNDVKRDVNLWIGNDVTLLTNGALNVRCMSDLNGGHVTAIAQQHVDDFIAFARAEATTKAKDYCTLSIGQRDDFRAKGKVVIESRTTTKKGGGYYADALLFIHKDDIKLYGAPKANATVKLDTWATVVINRDGYYMTRIRNEETGGIYVSASNGQLNAFSNTDVRAASVYTEAYSTAKTHVDADNCIWVDRTEFSSPYSAKLFAQIGDGGNAHLNSNAFVSLQVAGSEYSSTTVEGSLKTTIRTSDPHHVRGPENFVHKTYSSVAVEQHARCKGNDYVTSHHPKTTDATSLYRRCDLCDGTANNGLRAIRSTVVKTMVPLHDVVSENRPDASISVARFGGKDDRIAKERYVLYSRVVLDEDTTLSAAQLASMQLWTNMATGLDAYLLPNAARLFTDGEGGLQFISEVLHGDAFLDGEADDIDIFTALTSEAFAKPVVPIGSSSSLDFRDGLLTLAEFVDFELFVHEVSGAWFCDRFSDGFFRMLSANQDEINDCALKGHDLPQGRITEGIVEGEAMDGRRLYWIGATPDTALSPDETLIFMLLDEETDEADFYRTSVNMLQRGDAPVDQSLYLYRDSKSDRAGVEKYNIMFFDTPKGQKSLVKTVTDVLGDRELETPTALKIILRRFYLEGADLPAYSLFNHVFVMNDITDGESSVFDGQYEATFQNGVFDSDYTRVEGIYTGELKVILKAGNDVWLQWTGAEAGQDVVGNIYRLEGGEWVLEPAA